VLPGFGQAAEAPSTALRTGLLFPQKDPKPLTPHLASLKRMDASLRRADQLVESILSFAEGLKQGPPDDKSVPPLGQTAGVGTWATNFSGIHTKEREAIYSVWSGSSLLLQDWIFDSFRFDPEAFRSDLLLSYPGTSPLTVDQLLWPLPSLLTPYPQVKASRLYVAPTVQRYPSNSEEGEFKGLGFLTVAGTGVFSKPGVFM